MIEPKSFNDINMINDSFDDICDNWEFDDIDFDDIPELELPQEADISIRKCLKNAIFGRVQDEEPDCSTNTCTIRTSPRISKIVATGFTECMGKEFTEKTEASGMLIKLPINKPVLKKIRSSGYFEYDCIDNITTLTSFIVDVLNVLIMDSLFHDKTADFLKTWSSSIYNNVNSINQTISLQLRENSFYEDCINGGEITSILQTQYFTEPLYVEMLKRTAKSYYIGTNSFILNQQYWKNHNLQRLKRELGFHCTNDFYESISSINLIFENELENNKIMYALIMYDSQNHESLGLLLKCNPGHQGWIEWAGLLFNNITKPPTQDVIVKERSYLQSQCCILHDSEHHKINFLPGNKKNNLTIANSGCLSSVTNISTDSVTSDFCRNYILSLVNKYTNINITKTAVVMNLKIEIHWFIVFHYRSDSTETINCKPYAMRVDIFSESRIISSTEITEQDDVQPFVEYLKRHDLSSSGVIPCTSFDAM